MMGHVGLDGIPSVFTLRNQMQCTLSVCTGTLTHKQEHTLAGSYAAPLNLTPHWV